MDFPLKTMMRDPMPPEMVAPMFEAPLGWAQKHRASGKLERMWNFAGLQGGGGILNVDSHEELEAIMNEFPPGAVHGDRDHRAVRPGQGAAGDHRGGAVDGGVNP